MKGKLFLSLLVLIVGVLLIGSHGLEARAQGSRASLEVAAESSVTHDTEAGVDASSARWTALGAYYTAKYEAAAAASSARWTALGAYYTAKYEAAAAASSARYEAIAEWYSQKGLSGRK
jgi:hypothetical protein